MLTKHFLFWYTVLSDRVAEACEACDQGSSCGDSLLYYGGVMPKPFLCYEDQIKKLVNEKGLVISDTKYAIDMLKQIGYFGLISGYKLPFKNLTTKNTKMELVLKI